MSACLSKYVSYTPTELYILHLYMSDMSACLSKYVSYTPKELYILHLYMSDISACLSKYVSLALFCYNTWNLQNIKRCKICLTV